MHRFKTYGCLALVFGLCSQLSALEEWPPESGTLVRISASKVFQRSTDVVSTYRQTKFTGTVIAALSDTLEIQVENSSLQLIIPAAYLQKVEVSCGYKKKRKHRRGRC